MKLTLANRREFVPIRILGEPEVVAGHRRDVLTIHFDPNEYSVDILAEVFGETFNTSQMWTEDTSGEPVLMGVGYCIYMGTAPEVLDVPSPVGLITEPRTEIVNVVKLAQLTYEEYQQYLHGQWTHPEV